MVRLLRHAIPLALVALVLAPVAHGEGDDKPAARLASDDVAAEAIETFKDAYKARGLRGEEKDLQRDFAMSELALVQHPDVVKEFAKITKSGDEVLRALAVIYLGEQRLLPGLASPPILSAMKRHGKDTMLILSGLQSLGRLRSLTATKVIGEMLDHQDFAVKKAAIQAVGQIGEMRLWKEICKYAGVTVRDKDADETEEGSTEIVEEGWSYDGVSVTYDTGTSGDHDQKMAEKIGKAQLAKNKAAAGAKPSGRGGGGVGRNPKELLPFALHTLFLLTGERFASPKDLVAWIRKNRQTIRERIELLDQLEKAQKEEARELR